jgi:hypothetical protein
VHHSNVRPNDTQINSLLDNNDIHTCPSCPTLSIYGRIIHLENHIRKRHLIKRTKTNLEFVTDTYRNADSNTWQQALAFLNHLSPEPPPFRSTIYRHVQAQTKSVLHATYHTINQWILLSSTPLDTNHPNVDPIDNTSDPFWKLSFIFEALILFPPSTKTTNAGYSNIVKQRLTQFRQGNIIALYEEAFDKEKYTPNPNKPPSFDNALEISHSAQVAADADNFGAANQRIQSCMPVVNITKDIFNDLQLLYPQRTNFPCHQSETHYPEFAEKNTRTTKTNTTTTTPFANSFLDRDTTIRALRNVKKGTAPGPFTFSTDFLRAYALTRNKRQSDDSYIYLDTYMQISHMAISNQLSPTITRIFGSQYFTAFYKDKNDLNKKRPLGIGTALRRITGSILMAHFRNDISKINTPDGQYGIAVKGGLEFIIHKAQAQ